MPNDAVMQHLLKQVPPGGIGDAEAMHAHHTTDDEMAERILEASKKADHLYHTSDRYLQRSSLYQTILLQVKAYDPEQCIELQQAVQAYLRNKAEQHSMPYHPSQPEKVRMEKRYRLLQRRQVIQQTISRLTKPSGCEQSIQLVLAASTGVLLAHATMH
jgi:hypothetical protein